MRLNRETILPCQKPYIVIATAPHSAEISRAIDILIDHFKEKLCFNDVRQAVDLSRATLCRHFRRYTGRSFIESLNGVRIDHACRLSM
jgi:transcriptional regulator GlxA family with amidase domain